MLCHVHNVTYDHFGWIYFLISDWVSYHVLFLYLGWGVFGLLPTTAQFAMWIALVTPCPSGLETVWRRVLFASLRLCFGHSLRFLIFAFSPTSVLCCSCHWLLSLLQSLIFFGIHLTPFWHIFAELLTLILLFVLVTNYFDVILTSSCLIACSCYLTSDTAYLANLTS